MRLFMPRISVFVIAAVTLIGTVSGCSDRSANNRTQQAASPANPNAGKAAEYAIDSKPDPSHKIADPATTDRANSSPEVPRQRDRPLAADTRPTEGADSSESLDSLLAGLSRPIGGSKSAVSLNRLGEPAIDGVLNVLNSEDATARKNAAFCLGLTWSTAQAGRKIAALTEVAEHDSDPKVRHQAAVAMALLAGRDDVDPQLKVAIVPTMTRAIQNESASRATRSHLAGVVGNMGHKGHPMIPAMISLLEDEDDRTRSNAANAIGLLASPYPIKRGQVVRDGELPDYHASRESTDLAVDALISALADTDAKVRAEAARGLGHIGPAAAASVVALTRQLLDEDTETRLRAAESLVLIAPDPSGASETLEQAAANETGDPLTRWWRTRAQRLLEEIHRAKPDRRAKN